MGISGCFLDLIYLGETSCHHNYSSNSIITRGAINVLGTCLSGMCGTHLFRYLSEVGKSRRSHPESGRYRKDTKSDYLTKLMFVGRNKLCGGVGSAPGLKKQI